MSTIAHSPTAPTFLKTLSQHGFHVRADEVVLTDLHANIASAVIAAANTTTAPTLFFSGHDVTLRRSSPMRRRPGQIVEVVISTVPEPGSLALAGLALLAPTLQMQRRGAQKA
jgi:hypothetical protein